MIMLIYNYSQGNGGDKMKEFELEVLLKLIIEVISKSESTAEAVKKIKALLER